MVTRDFLKSVELFSALSPADADALAGLAHEEVFQKGQTIFRERDPGGKEAAREQGRGEERRGEEGGRGPTSVDHFVSFHWGCTNT